MSYHIRVASLTLMAQFLKIVLVVTNWSTLLEKHQTIEILLMVDILCIFLNIAFFEMFQDFF